jgi:hypothetical protein
LVSIRDAHYVGTTVTGEERQRVSLWRGYIQDSAPMTGHKNA